MGRSSVKLVTVLIFVLLFTACDIPSGESVNREWELIEDSAMNTTVNLYAWDGNHEANEWIDKYLKKDLMTQYGITLNRIPMSYLEIFQIFENDRIKENKMGEIDLLWISGANFKYAYENDYLFGPFADKLPNFKNKLNSKDPEVMYDMFYPTRGYEVPFGKSQFMMFFNEDILFEPPTNYQGLKQAAMDNPGMITYPAPPNAVGSAFVRSFIYSHVGYKTFMDMKAEKTVVAAAIMPAISDLKEMEPYLWKKGERYPVNAEELDQLFFDGEIMVSMSHDHNHGTDKVSDFKYPDGTKPLILESFAGRTHYLAIPDTSTNKSGAMVVINYAISADAQASKFRIGTWGDIPVLERGLLTTDEIRQLKKAVTKKTSPKLDHLLDNRVPEMPTDIAKLVDEIWMEEVGQ